MSIVVCKVKEDGIEFAADSIAVWGETKRVDVAPKLFKVNNIIAGGSGVNADIFLLKTFLEEVVPEGNSVKDILQFQSKFTKWCKNLGSEKQINFNYIIGFEGKVFEVYNLDIEEIKNYTAIGSGFVYALPVLDMGFSAKRAVEEAIKFSTVCAAPVITINMRR